MATREISLEYYNQTALARGDKPITSGVQIVQPDVALAFQKFVDELGKNWRDSDFADVLGYLQDASTGGADVIIGGLRVNFESFGYSNDFNADDFNISALSDMLFLHLVRNATQEENLTYSEVIRSANDFLKVSNHLNVYHQIEAHGFSGNKGNVKWLSADGREEYIFKETETGWVLVKDPINSGSYNYGPPGAAELSEGEISYGSDHLWLDIVPWETFGNLIEDPTDESDRGYIGLPPASPGIATLWEIEPNSSGFLIAPENDDQRRVYIFKGDETDNTIISGEFKDRIFGGDGVDLVSYVNSATGVTINLQKNLGYDGSASRPDEFDGYQVADKYEELYSIENIVGSAYSDIIIGSNDENSLFGSSGNDVIYGLDSDDTISGGRDDDIIYGGSGVNTAIYSRSRADYEVINLNETSYLSDAEIIDASSAYIISSVRATPDQGWDFLTDIQKVQFADGTWDIQELVTQSTEAEPTILYSEDYEDDNVGTLPSDHTLVFDGLSADLQDVQINLAGNRFLDLQGKTNGDATVRKELDVGVSGNYSVEWDWRIEDPVDFGRSWPDPVLGQSYGSSSFSFKEAGGDGATLLRVEVIELSDGKLYVAMGPSGDRDIHEISYGDWFTSRLDVNSEDGTVSLYINDTYVTTKDVYFHDSDNPRSGHSDSAGLVFKSANHAEGTAQFDNIRIVDAAHNEEVDLTSLSGEVEDFSGPDIGGWDAHGIEIVDTPLGSGAEFSYENESRLLYPYASEDGFPRSGTLEITLYVESGYQYRGYTNPERFDYDDRAFVFGTDIPGGDVTWPGSSWLTVQNSGDITFSIAKSKYAGSGGDGSYIRATGTDFRMDEWNTISMSFGSEGMALALNGEIIGTNSNTQTLAGGGTHGQSLGQPTIGEGIPSFWADNQWEGGFNGIVEAVRVSEEQMDFQLADAIANAGGESNVVIPEESHENDVLSSSDIEQIYLSEGLALVKGEAEDLDGDEIFGFGEDATLLVFNRSFDDGDMRVTMGSAILDIDTDQDGEFDTQITFKGDYEDAVFSVNAFGPHTEITVSFEEENLPPLPQDDGFTFAEDADPTALNLLGNDSDPEDDTLSIVSIDTSSLLGNAVLNDDGSVSYEQTGVFEVLDDGESGFDTFTYTVSDGVNEATATVTINIEGITDMNEVSGTSGRDNLVGTDGADAIRSLGGSYDRMTGGAGADEFIFGDETNNGRRERDVIMDYGVGIDSIVLKAGASVASIRETSSQVVVFLDGDRDAIYVRGEGVTADNLTIISDDMFEFV